MIVLVIPLLTVACTAAEPLGAGDHFRSLELGSQKRTYRIHVPPGYNAARPMPLVLALHGATMSARAMEGFSGLSKKADEAGFIVVYPNGTGPNPLMLTWNSGGFPPFLARTKPNDVAFLARVLDDAEAVLNVDKQRIYATGVSNGAMMCYRLAAELSERIAAIAPVAGTLALEKYEPKCTVPVLHIHGTADNLVPYVGAGPTVATFMKFLSVEDTIAACVKRNGCLDEPRTADLPMPNDHFKITRTAYDEGKEGAEVILYVVERGGHTWPGRPIAGGILGPTTMNLKANDVIWEFFQKHLRRPRLARP
jgi:polyhydroxybutyrate depolymerase